MNIDLSKSEIEIMVKDMSFSVHHNGLLTDSDGELRHRLIEKLSVYSAAMVAEDCVVGNDKFCFLSNKCKRCEFTKV